MKSLLGFNFYDIAIYMYVILFSLICFYPIWYVFLGSINPSESVASAPMILFPDYIPSFRYYKFIFSTPVFTRALFISLTKTLSGSFCSVVFTSALAYGVSKKKVMGMKTVNLFMIFTMFFGGGLIPTFLLMSQLYLRNTFLGLIILGFVSTGNFIIMRNYYSYSVVPELEDSALIDGANEIILFFRIVIPMSMSMLSAIFLFESVGHWNDWTTFLIYMDDFKYRPFVYLLKELLTKPKETILRGQDYSRSGQLSHSLARMPEAALKYTTIMIAIVPIFTFYPFLQKHFAKGVLIGAVKE